MIRNIVLLSPLLIQVTSLNDESYLPLWCKFGNNQPNLCCILKRVVKGRYVHIWNLNKNRDTTMNELAWKGDFYFCTKACVGYPIEIDEGWKEGIKKILFNPTYFVGVILLKMTYNSCLKNKTSISTPPIFIVME